MATLAEASLSAAERRALDRVVALLRERLGDELLAVWLYGSRARGEVTGPDSDIDVLVVTAAESFELEQLARATVLEAALAEGLGLGQASTQVMSSEYLDDRRRIRSFFVQEVDRDKLVLYERPGR